MNATQIEALRILDAAITGTTPAGVTVGVARHVGERGLRGAAPVAWYVAESRDGGATWRLGAECRSRGRAREEAARLLAQLARTAERAAAWEAFVVDARPRIAAAWGCAPADVTVARQHGGAGLVVTIAGARPRSLWYVDAPDAAVARCVAELTREVAA